MVSFSHKSTSGLTVMWIGKQLQYFVTITFPMNKRVCVHVSVSYLHIQYISVFVYGSCV